MILVTGFEPYKEEFNASAELVNSLKLNPATELHGIESEIAYEVIGVDTESRQSEHESLESQLQTLLNKYKPDLCIFIGQAPPYSKITIEKVGLNSFIGEEIDPDRPVAYWSDLPGLNKLKDKLHSLEIPASFSFNAGQHLCNHILYSSLYLAQKYKLAHKSGFIHIPVLPKQVIKQYRECPSMPLSMTREALSIIIKHVYESSNT